MKYYYVELIRKELGILTLQPVDEEARLFSSIPLLEKWLTDNDFIYGQRSFLNYPTGDHHGIHKDDTFFGWVDVIITEMNLDDCAESKFKDLRKINRQWLADYIKAMELE